MKDGILIINKPQEMTSFDVVAILRKKLGIKRIGHLGTLDPMAEGVLPIALGKAARIMDYLNADTKEYVGEFLFGITSDTDDIWGNDLRLNDSGNILRDDLETEIKKFSGIIDQIPPKYSAIKVDGHKLYEYARAGKDVDIKSRKVYIESFDIMDFGKRYVDEVEKELCYAIVRIVCSKGTYIRSLARDIGDALGVGGVMSALMRRRSGAFCIDDATSIEDIRNMETEEIENLIIKIEDALSEFPSVVLGKWESNLFGNGVKLERTQWEENIEYDASRGETDYIVQDPGIKKQLEILPEHRTYKVFGPDGFIGMGIECDEGMLKAEKVLA